MKVILSASRRTDLVASYPQELVQRLGEYPSERVHSIVLWTKNAHNLRDHALLRNALLEYDQLFIHFSITGMGDSLLEPNTSRTEESLSLLPELIALAGSPERISVRFDPIVNLRIDGAPYTNLGAFPAVADAAARQGIRRITTSWMTYYRKVARRFAPFRIEPVEFDWRGQADFLLGQCERRGLQLHACCVEGLPMSRCIDGPLLQALHPKGERCSRARAREQRPRCGCTASKDLGWYSHVCGGGCLYCYATPAAENSAKKAGTATVAPQGRVPQEPVLRESTHA